MKGNQENKLLGIKERSYKDVMDSTGNTVSILTITLYGMCLNTELCCTSGANRSIYFNS